MKQFGKFIVPAAGVVAIILALPIFWSWISPPTPPTPHRLSVKNGIFQQSDTTAPVVALSLPESLTEVTTPLDLLRWQQQVTGLVGRDTELQQLLAWAESNPPL